MVSPDFFRVDYAINPYMKDATGKLNQIDVVKAADQWNFLKRTYEKLGYFVEVIPGQIGLPDMVFAANQSFNIWDEKEDRPAVILSQMRAAERSPEVPFFRNWYQEKGYAIKDLPVGQGSFEGNGDAIPHPGEKWIWGGYGFRTDKKIYSYLTELINREFVLLELVSEHFYHLDTCFTILNEDTVAIQPEAFSKESLRQIKDRVANVIEIDKEECLKFFAGNAHCPNGKDVLMNPGSKKFTAELEKRGFRCHEIETAEFMKSGGSVFCLKMMCY